MENFVRKISHFKNKRLKSPVEVLLHEATSNENWNVSTQVLDSISQYSLQPKHLVVIMKHLWKRLDQKSRKWRKIEKCLAILEHLIYFGDPQVIHMIRQYLLEIKTFQDFHVFEKGVNKGTIIRNKSTRIVQLITQPEFLEKESSKARALKQRMQQNCVDQSIDDNQQIGGAIHKRSVSFHAPSVPLHDSDDDYIIKDTKKYQVQTEAIVKSESIIKQDFLWPQQTQPPNNNGFDFSNWDNLQFDGPSQHTPPKQQNENTALIPKQNKQASDDQWQHQELVDIFQHMDTNPAQTTPQLDFKQLYNQSQCVNNQQLMRFSLFDHVAQTPKEYDNPFDNKDLI